MAAQEEGVLIEGGLGRRGCRPIGEQRPRGAQAGARWNVSLCRVHCISVRGWNACAGPALGRLAIRTMRGETPHHALDAGVGCNLHVSDFGPARASYLCTLILLRSIR
eukprot:1919633-Prymnesium_polylepis.1